MSWKRTEQLSYTVQNLAQLFFSDSLMCSHLFFDPDIQEDIQISVFPTLLVADGLLTTVADEKTQLAHLEPEFGSSILGYSRRMAVNMTQSQ